MKRKRDMDSKAGTNPKEKKPVLKNVLSKSAAMLLVIVTGLSTMSFVQDKAFAGGIDTNQSVAGTNPAAAGKVAPGDEACCATVAVNPGKGVNTAYFISTPGKKAMYKADRETIVTFLSEAKERRIWSMNKQVAAIEADKEMHFNFKLGAMYPSAGMAVEADKEMSSHFVDGIVNIAVLATDAAAGADREVAGHFITANLYVTAADPTAEQVAKADAEMIAAFEKASRPLIGIPSAADAQKADREMLHNYEWQAKLAAVK